MERKVGMKFKMIFLLLTLNLSLCVNASNYSDIFIVGDNLILREQPSKESKSIGKLLKGNIVRLIKKSGKKEVINGCSGEWVYVGTSRSDSISKLEKKDGFSIIMLRIKILL